MPLDPNIILGIKPLDVAAIQQETQQRQMNNLKLQEAQQGIAEQNALRQMYNQPGFDPNSPEAIRQMYRVSPQLGIKYETERSTLMKNRLDQLKVGHDVLQQKLGMLSANPSDDNITSTLQEGVKSGFITPEHSSGILRQVSNLGLQDRSNFFLNMSADAKDRYTKQVISAADKLHAATTRRGQDITADTARRGQDITLAGQNKPPAGYRYTPEGNLEGIPGGPAGTEGINPVVLRQREKEYPKAKSAVSALNEGTNNLIRDLTELRNHPGLPAITGLVGGRFDTQVGAGEDARVLYDNIKATGVLTAMKGLKEAGASFGQQSDKEGELLKQSASKLARTLSTGDFQKRIDQYIADLKGSKNRVNGLFGDTYSYKTINQTATPSAPAAGQAAPAPAQSGLTPAEQAELAALKKKHGR